MKQVYFIIVLFFSLNSFSQNDLLGEWYLNSINYNGVQLDNYLTPEIGYTLSLNFNEIIEAGEDTLFFFEGYSGCSVFSGTYGTSGSLLSLSEFSFLSEGCLGAPQSRYEQKYLEIISSIGGNPSDTLEYVITGIGTDAILTITKSNGNSAVYGKTPIFETLFKTWYLTTIEDNGTTILIPATDSPILRLTTSTDPVSRILYDGIGDCNAFSGYYSIYATDDNALTIFEFDASLATCDSAYEPLYFDTFQNSSTNYLTYELVNERQTLILTDLWGRKLYFGNQPITQEILGEWNLYYIEVDGSQQYSTIPNSVNNIVFNDDNTFNGGVCSNGYGGIYSVTDSNTLDITNLNALAGGCDYPTEIQSFLNPYFWTVLSNMDTSNTFSYVISGSGTNETLKITNSNNDSAFYGRSSLPENKLPGTWYLQSITKDNVQEVNVYEPTFNIDFGLSPDSGAGLDYDGFAICHDYFGSYQLERLDGVRFNYISYTLDFCQQYGGMFEESYFSFFGEAASGTMLLDYEVFGSGDDETLILTDADGDFITYGRQPINVPDTELVNQWYLQYINVDGEQLDNFYNRPSYSLKLDLTNIAENPSENRLYYNGASSCNEFGGSYTYTESSLTFEFMAITLIGCDLTPQGMYESYYLNHILTSDNNLPSTLDYTLTDSGINQTLTLTAASGDFAVYGKTAPTTQFFTTWYLSSIESNGIITEISSTEAPTINFTADRSHPILPGLNFDGQGDCNAFSGEYSMYIGGMNLLTINSFIPESASCNSDYETEYFDILNSTNTNQLSFELLDANSTLRLTNLAGNKLVYASQPLSVSENTVNNLSIRLKENPVKSELLLITNTSLGNRLSYQIFSVDGKQIQERQILKNDVINVQKLNSGLYFLVVSSENNLKQTLKFIKE